jgi:hypothetical protein
MWSFYGEMLLAPRPTPMMEGHPPFGGTLSVAAYSVYSQLPSKLEAVSAIHNRMTRHALVQEMHLFWKNGILVHVRMKFSFQWQKKMWNVCVLSLFFYQRCCMKTRRLCTVISDACILLYIKVRYMGWKILRSYCLTLPENHNVTWGRLHQTSCGLERIIIFRYVTPYNMAVRYPFRANPLPPFALYHCIRRHNL